MPPSQAVPYPRSFPRLKNALKHGYLFGSGLFILLKLSSGWKVLMNVVMCAIDSARLYNWPMFSVSSFRDSQLFANEMLFLFRSRGIENAFRCARISSWTLSFSCLFGSQSHSFWGGVLPQASQRRAQGCCCAPNCRVQ
jgi:hypothetical protein